VLDLANSYLDNNFLLVLLLISDLVVELLHWTDAIQIHLYPTLVWCPRTNSFSDKIR